MQLDALYRYLTDVLAASPPVATSRFRRRQDGPIVASLTVPTLWGNTGTPNGTDDLGRAVWGYTARQVQSMIDRIDEAAASAADDAVNGRDQMFPDPTNT